MSASWPGGRRRRGGSTKVIDKMGPSHTEVIRKMTVSIGTSSTAGGDSGGERRVHRITVTVLWVRVISSSKLRTLAHAGLQPALTGTEARAAAMGDIAECPVLIVPRPPTQ